MATNNVINQSNPASVSDGGTGIDTMGVAYGVLCSGTTATGPLLVTSPGTAGQVLTSNGNAASPTYQNVGAGTGAWVLISTQDAASSATVDFANLLTNTYRYYKIVAFNVVPATNGVDFYMRFGTGATPTWVSANYQWSGVVGNSAGNPATSGSASDAQMILNNTVSTLSNTAAKGCNFVVDIFDPSNASYAKNASCMFDGWTSGTTGNNIVVSAGSYNVTGAISSVRFLTSSGNISTGKFQLWGLNGS